MPPDARVVVFDADLYRLPSVRRFRRGLQFTLNPIFKPAAVFSYGMERPHEDGGFYYDTFATIDASGFFQTKEFETAMFGNVKDRRLRFDFGSVDHSHFARVESAFGGLGIYDAHAYLSANCSYIRPSDAAMQYSKLGRTAKVDNVYGWPCEHVVMNLCVGELTGRSLYLARDMMIVRRGPDAKTTFRVGIREIPIETYHSRDTKVLIGSKRGRDREYVVTPGMIATKRRNETININELQEKNTKLLNEVSRLKLLNEELLKRHERKVQMQVRKSERQVWDLEKDNQQLRERVRGLGELLSRRTGTR